MLIRAIDLETCGLAPPAGVCELAFVDLVSTTRDLAYEPSGWQIDGGNNQWLVNPGQPIPPETSAIHHLIDEDVADAPVFSEVVAHLFDKRPSTPAHWPESDPEGTILAAHNAKFERQWLTPEITGPLRWIDSYKTALRLWPDAPSHSNQALRYWRKPVGLDRDRANVAHRAWPDAYVTAYLLRDMLDLATIDQLVEWSSQPALQVRCQIGKWRGTPWREVDYGFLDWVSTRDFDEDVLFTVKTEMERRTKEAAEARATSC